MTLNGRILGIAIALSLLAPLGFALLPALRMSRPDMDELRQGNRGAESTKGRRLREALVAAQVALALILMTQVGLIGRTTWKLHHLDKGFDPAQLLTLRMNLDETGYRDLAVAHNFYTRAIERIQALPGVTSAGTSSAVPFVDREVSEHFSIQGRPAPPPDSKPQAARAAVSADYLKTMRIPIVRGRGFVRADFANAPPVALVSREAARRYWSGEDPIGRRIAFDGDQNAWLEVVGVVGDVQEFERRLRADTAGVRAQTRGGRSDRPRSWYAALVRIRLRWRRRFEASSRSSTRASRSTTSAACSGSSSKISGARTCSPACSASLRLWR